MSSSEIFCDRYTVYRRDRYQTKIMANIGGGVLIAVRSNIRSEEYMTDATMDLEAICVKITLSTGTMFIYALYIQPTASIDIYREHVNAIKSVQSTISSSDNFIIFGDFNLNTVNWCENDGGFDYVPLIGDSQSVKSIIAGEITSTMLQNGFFQMTNLRNKSNNVLDLIFTNSPELTVVTKADFRMIPEHKSDNAHVPIACTIECEPGVIPSSDSGSVFCFRRADYDAIGEHLDRMDMMNILSGCGDDVDEMVTTFYSILHETFDLFVPKATIRSSKKPKWHDKKLNKLKNLRNKEYRKLCADRISSINADESKFIVARNEFENYRRELHAKFIKEQASNLRHNPAAFWRHINDKRKTNGLPQKIKYNNVYARSDIEKANIFAEYFKSVYVDHGSDHDLHALISNRPDMNHFNITASMECVLAVLNEMDLSKGSGHDGVSSFFLRKCAVILANPLSIIFTKSLEKCVYPAPFRIGQITPIYKSGSRIDVTNYRGVNVLPNLAKVFERVVYNQMKLIALPLIPTSQHGFVSNRNIESNLMEQSTLIHDAFEQNAQIDCVYFDIKKAFDVVNPIELIRKLSRFPVKNSILLWFMSYLNDRKQYVKVGAAISEIFGVLSGVGQGTVFGPLLFIIFFSTSDITLPGIFILNFADDKKFLSIIKNINDCIVLQRAINKFLCWCVTNGLEINKSKCKVMTFTLKRKSILYDYVIDEQPVERVNHIRDLGVMMDSKLNFNIHYEYISNKAMNVLLFVKRQMKFFDNDIIKILYMTLVRSNLEFAACVWNPYHNVHRNSIESAQKQMVMLLNDDYGKRVENDCYILSPYVDRCQVFELTPLIRRRVNAAVFLIHAIIIGKIKSPRLRSILDLNTGVRTLRNPEFIRLKHCRTDHSTYSPFNMACRAFNHAALFVDPTLPHFEFRKRVLRLPDSSFGPWSKL